MRQRPEKHNMRFHFRRSTSDPVSHIFGIIKHSGWKAPLPVHGYGTAYTPAYRNGQNLPILLQPT
jgi:hypothetical protein